jgi:hypothetical protein
LIIAVEWRIGPSSILPRRPQTPADRYGADPWKRNSLVFCDRRAIFNIIDDAQGARDCKNELAARYGTLATRGLLRVDALVNPLAIGGA